MVQANADIERILATIGAVLAAVAPLPQVILSFRSKSTEGLSPFLMITWQISDIPWAAYAVAENLSIALLAQVHLFILVAGISWTQTLHYGYRLSIYLSIVAFAINLTFAGILELTTIYTIKYGKDHGSQVPGSICGYGTDVLAIVGILPQYIEIWRRREVKGVSLPMIAVYVVGGVFSGISLFFRQELPIPALIFYVVMACTEAGIIVLAWILNPAARRREREVSVRNMESGGNAIVLPQAGDEDIAKSLPTLLAHPSGAAGPPVDEAVKAVMEEKNEPQTFL